MPATGTSDNIPHARFRFVGGKGGVGKTTCAAAFAVASAARGVQTLVLSSDPAPSLGDALACPLGASPRAVPGQPRLDALELDAAAALRRWLRTRRPTLEQIALRGTWLDEEDVARLLQLSLPGIDEVAALLEIARLGASSRYDLIVVDTAPTGHTLRMLALPTVLTRVAAVFDHMQQKHRTLAAALRGSWQPDAADALIAALAADGRDLESLLRDSARSEIWWVTLPEPMAIEETVDAIGHLSGLGIPVAGVIANQLTPPPASRCGWCTARVAFEARAVAGLARRTATTVGGVVARAVEPRGVRSLRQIGREIIDGNGLPGWRGLPRSPRSRGRLSGRHVESGLTAATRLLLAAGKGGVGKTTCAAALALEAARSRPSARVLLLSVDPAHSVGDVLGAPTGDTPARVRGAPPNLMVREMDAPAQFQALQRQYLTALESLFARISTGSVDLAHDRQVLRDLLELAPPGLDELVAVIEVTAALHEGGVDLLVMDTAPTGHALRLLEMPDLVQAWVKALMAILLKYRQVLGLGELGELLLRLSREIGRLRALLTDGSRCSVAVVTRPAALPRAETLRLVRRLSRAGLHVTDVIVNAIGRGTCPRCRRSALQQEREIRTLSSTLPRRQRLTAAPSFIPPPQGPAELRQWRAQWRALR